MSSDAPAIQLVGIAKSYGSAQALKPTNLTVGNGEFVSLLGPSGSGKTTILGITAGIVTPDVGQVISHGLDVTHQPPHLRNVGMVFQRYTLFPNQTVAENVAFPLRARHMPKSEVDGRVSHFLGLVGLSRLADRYPSQVSGGEAQRVALARALVFGPALLLMDEPLGALDRRLRQGLQEEIRRIQHETRVPTLYVTHDQDEAMSMSDRIVIIREGAIVDSGPPRRLYREPVSLWAAEFLGDANACRAESLHEHEGGCIAMTEDGVRLPARRAAGVTDADAHVVIRPEEVLVEKGTGEGRLGKVVDVVFLGAVQHLRIRLDGGWVVRATLPARQEIAAGEDVSCRWADDAPIVVPRF